MRPEEFDIEAVMEARRKSVEATIRAMDGDKVKALGEQLFPNFDHPWREAFFTFVNENPGSTFHHAVTHDGVNILYCRDKEKGLWFNPGGGCGPLQARGLAILKEVTSTH